MFADRYHARILRTPREVRGALAYVLCNARRHRVRLAGVDCFSTGPWFEGWRGLGSERIERVRRRMAKPVLRARTWLLSIGWRRHGLVRIDEVPGSR